MKNIKISFHHPNFIYKFKLDLILYQKPSSLIQIDYENICKNFDTLRQHLILTNQQQKMLQSLSIGFKKQFIKKLEVAIQQRRNIQKLQSFCLDYLGQTYKQHYQSFMGYFQQISQNNLLQQGNFKQNAGFLIVKQLHFYFKNHKKLNQTTRNQCFKQFCNIRLINQLQRIITGFHNYKLNRTDAYTLYHCIMTILNDLITYNYYENQTNFMNKVINIGLISFKQINRCLKFQDISQISLLFFQMLQIKLQHQKSMNWVYESDSNYGKLIDILLAFLSQQNHNIVVIFSIFAFLQKIYLRCSSMNQLLMFVTTCINLKIISKIDEKYNSYRIGVYKSKETLSVGIIDEMATQNFGKKVIRLRQKQYSDKKWNMYFKKGFKIIATLKQKFEQFKAGKVVYTKQRKLSIQQEKQKASQQIQILQKFQEYQVTYADHKFIFNQLKQVKTQNQQLFQKYQKAIDDNEQLVKINKWYQQLVNQKTKIIRELEDAISQFVNVKQKYRNGYKINLQSNVFQLKIHPHKLQSTYIQQIKDKIDTKNDNSPQNLNNNHILPPPPPPPSNYRSSQKSNTRNSRNSISSIKHILPPPPPLSILPQISLPPPLPSALPHFSSTKNYSNENKLNKQMKAINWTAVQISKVKDSFWQKVQEVEVNTIQIQQMFCKNNNTSKNLIPKAQKKQMRSLLTSSRAKNIEIVLKKIKIDISCLPKAVEVLDQDILTMNNVDSYLKILPTDRQIEEFSQLPQKLQMQQWTIADQFIMISMRITNFHEILNAIKFKNQFPNVSKNYQKNIVEFIQFFTALQGDNFLKDFFRQMLSIGNFMNQNNNRGNAYGFRLQSIQKTYSIQNSNNTQTLFEYILNSLQNRGVQIPTQSQYFKRSFIVPLQVLREDLKQFRKMCENVQECLLRSDEQDKRVTQYFLGFYIQVREQVSLLEQKFNIAYRILNSVADYYCQKLQVQKIVRYINEFKQRVRRYKNRKKYMKTNK